MAEMNGFEAATKIHRLCVERGIPLVPVVAVTASVSTSLHEECREAGMMQVVTKPFDVIDLMPVFNAVIDARRAQGSSPSPSSSSRQASAPATLCSPATKASMEGAGRTTIVSAPCCLRTHHRLDSGPRAGTVCGVGRALGRRWPGQ